MEAAAAPAPRRGPLFEPAREVRFAVVLYGGVSLAIYINGMVQELLHLVRATAPDRPSSQVYGSADVFTAVPEPTGTEAVYRRLGQMLGVSDQVLDVPEDNSAAPIRTRFVVDILSGSSAGGLNALFLGKALANEESIDGLKALWTGEADIAKLVNDSLSVADLDELALTDPIRSLLNSSRLYWELLFALTQMDGGGESPPIDSKLVDELDCWITATDLRGLHVPIKLYDESVDEKRFRSVFRFLYRSSHASGDPDDIQSDFRRADNPFLAFAGRCTSAFPFAFEPMELADVDAVLAQPEFHADYGELGSDADWDRFIRDYVRARDVPGNTLTFPKRPFGDGGYLDNKPFTWATDTISRRRADVPVDRRLIYLEPAPDRLDRNEPTWRPDAIENAQDALVTLPRYETIREDIERLLDRNSLVSRFRDVGKVVDLIAVDASEGIQPIAQDEWSKRHLADFEGQEGLVTERGFQWAAYHRLQVAGVLDDLADLVTTLLGFDATSDVYLAVRAIVQAWFAQVYETENDPRGRTQTSFLLDFDLAYRLRRLNFVDDRIEWMLRQTTDGLQQTLYVFEPSRSLEPAEWATFQDALRTLKPRLNDVFVRLRRAGREVRRLRPGTDAGAPVFEALGALDFQGPDRLVEAVLGGRRSPAEAFTAAYELVSNADRGPKLTAFADAIANAVRPSVDEARATAADLLAPVAGEPPGAALARVVVAHYYDRYESYDAVLYPLSYGASGDAGRVEVVRFSPLDATRLIDEERDPRGRRKLGGASINHFGGFLKKSWRFNDIMWGRLDAAERLIDTLLPVTVPAEVRDGLIRDAQLAIVHEERADVFPEHGESDDQLLDWIRKDYSVDLRLDQDAMLQVAGRGLRVTQKVLGGLSDDGHPVSKAGSLAAWVLPPPIEVLRRALQLPVRIAAWLCVAAAGGLIAGGDLGGVPAAARTGWALLPYVALAAVVLPLLKRALAGFFRVKAGRPGQGGLPWYVVAAAAVWGALLVFVPIALLSDAVRNALSFLPGWS